MQLHDTVRYVVEEILMSDKTAQCMAEETRRQNAKASVIVSRWLRQRVASQSSAQRPVNLIEIEARLCHVSRRCRSRAMVSRAMLGVGAVARQCTEHIVAVIEQYGWHRVHRQLRHTVRSREFICSMLYLMRTGVTYQRRLAYSTY